MASDRADDENPGCPLVARERVDGRPLAAGVSLREGVRIGCPLAAGGSAEASAGMGEEWTRRERFLVPEGASRWRAQGLQPAGSPRERSPRQPRRANGRRGPHHQHQLL
jgi:hypothetical protein